MCHGGQKRVSRRGSLALALARAAFCSERQSQTRVDMIKKKKKKKINHVAISQEEFRIQPLKRWLFRRHKGALEKRSGGLTMTPRWRNGARTKE